MSAAQALKVARAAGVHVNTNGNNLSLGAATPPSQGVLELLRLNKTDVMALLRPAQDGWSAEDWQVLFDERAAVTEYDIGLPRQEAEAGAYESCVAQWLYRNLASSPAGQCDLCKKTETRDDPVLCYTMEFGTHLWLHPTCSGRWLEAQTLRAAEALNRMGLSAGHEPKEGTIDGRA